MLQRVLRRAPRLRGVTTSEACRAWPRALRANAGPDFDRDKRDCGALSEVFLKAASRSLCGARRQAAKIPVLRQPADTALLQRNIQFGGDAVTHSAPRHRS